MSHTPLILDLDGTLIRSDTSFDLSVEHVKRRWLIGIVELFFWFVASRSKAKRRLIDLYADDFDVENLPFTELLESDVFKTAETRIIVSGSDDVIVQKIVAACDWADGGYGSTPDVNLIAQNKADLLKEKFPDGFDYVGDSKSDLKVWPHTRQAYGFNVSKTIQRSAKQQGIALEVLSEKPSPVRAIIKACRLHQWAKNGLLATMPFLSLSLFQPNWVVMLFLAFMAFGMVASATYLLNDLLDIQADRAHRTKRNRPFASGRLPIPTGVGIMCLLGALGMALAFLLHLGFFVMLMGYTTLSLVYSFSLKRVAILDTMFLSLLFCWRILAGGVLLGLPSNPWLLLSLWFFFFALALGKRAIELADKPAADTKIAGRGYIGQDFPLITMAGISASYASVIVIFIYAVLSESAVIQRELSTIAVVIVLVFWQVRFWLLVGRKEVHDDPVVFALKDTVSLITLGVFGVIVLVEQFIPIGTMVLGVPF